MQMESGYIASTTLQFPHTTTSGATLAPPLTENDLIFATVCSEHAWRALAKDEMAGYLSTLCGKLGQKMIFKTLKTRRLFSTSCANGNINVARMIYNIAPTSDDKKKLLTGSLHEAFRWACANGHLLISTWMIELFRDNNWDIDAAVTALNYYAFRFSVKNGYCDMADLLHQLGGGDMFFAGAMTVKQTAEFIRNDLFTDTCRSGHIDMIRWLMNNNKRSNEIIENYAGDSVGVYAKAKQCVYSVVSRQVGGPGGGHDLINARGVKYKARIFIAAHPTPPPNIAMSAIRMIKTDIEECCICMDCVSTNVTKCGHQFCETCLVRLAKKSTPTCACPLCRSPLALNECNRIIEMDV